MLFGRPDDPALLRLDAATTPHLVRRCVLEPGTAALRDIHRALRWLTRKGLAGPRAGEVAAQKEVLRQELDRRIRLRDGRREARQGIVRTISGPRGPRAVRVSGTDVPVLNPKRASPRLDMKWWMRAVDRLRGWAGEVPDRAPAGVPAKAVRALADGIRLMYPPQEAGDAPDRGWGGRPLPEIRDVMWTDAFGPPSPTPRRDPPPGAGLLLPPRRLYLPEGVRAEGTTGRPGEVGQMPRPFWQTVYRDLHRRAAGRPDGALVRFLAGELRLLADALAAQIPRSDGGIGDVGEVDPATVVRVAWGAP